MPRLSSLEILELEGRLAKWQTPDDMAQIVDETMDRIGSEVLFNQGGLAVLRDAWTAANFGKARQAARVRIVSDRWPDFELDLNGSIERFEAVEADDPTRRRGDEYKEGSSTSKPDPVEAWIARATEAPTWIAAASERKANKRYSAGAHLVVHLNLSEYGIRQQQVEASFRSATSAAKDSFDSVWVLWKGRAYLTWRGGKAQS
jgi:hypothetical protein